MNHQDTSSKILKILKREYQNELNPPKAKKSKNQTPTVSSLAFADITVWFYKRNCQQSLDEAKNVWELLPENPLQKQPLADFLNTYTEEIMDKYNKYIHYREKTSKIEQIYTRTLSLLDSVQSQYTLSDEFSSSEHPSEDSASFTICVNALEGHDLHSVFQDSDLIGHHIEIGDKHSTVSTPIEGTNGTHIDFKNARINYKMPLGKPSVTVSLYEDFNRNGYEYKVLVARKEIDLFSNLQYKISSPTVKGAGFDYQENNKYEVVRLAKVPKDGEFGGRRSVMDERRMGSNEFTSLSWTVAADGTQGKDGFSQYVDIIQRRLAYLEQKLKKLKLKTTGYKKKLMLMLLPFNDSIDFDGNSIIVNEKADMKKPNHHEKCNIF